MKNQYIQINRSSLSQQIAENLENMIIGQELQVGDRLPGENDLANKFGASRNVVREAMTMLRERGLIEVRNGSGSYVTRVQSNTLGNVVTRMTIGGVTTAQEVYEIRMALEVSGCRLAAQNCTNEEIEDLSNIVKDMENDYKNLDKWYEDDSKFHVLLANMTHNSLFPAFIEPMISVIFYQKEKDFIMPSLQARRGGVEQHKRILRAVINKDSDAAEKAMTDHLKAYLNDITNHE